MHKIQSSNVFSDMSGSMLLPLQKCYYGANDQNVMGLGNFVFAYLRKINTMDGKS